MLAPFGGLVKQQPRNGGGGGGKGGGDPVDEWVRREAPEVAEEFDKSLAELRQDPLLDLVRQREQHKMNEPNKKNINKVQQQLAGSLSALGCAICMLERACHGQCPEADVSSLSFGPWLACHCPCPRSVT
jgi:hypothetical protein